jgi:hypothetical protein
MKEDFILSEDDILFLEEIKLRVVIDFLLRVPSGGEVGT